MKTRSFVKLTIGAELRTQIVAAIKIRRGPANDNKDFRPVVMKAHKIKRIKMRLGDKGYDSEKNHELLRDELHAMSIIPPRHEDVPIWRTRGRYRKEMKRGYSKAKYHQRSKDETVFSVVKRTMGDEVRSVGVKAQNNETRLKIIACNAAKISSLAYSLFVGFLQSRRNIRLKYPNLGQKSGMMRHLRSSRILVALGAILLIVTPLAASAGSGPYLTTSVIPYNVAQQTINGNVGIVASFNSTLSSPTSIDVFLIITNVAGQTVYVALDSWSSFASGHPLTVFFGLPITELGHGNFTASVMATTGQLIAISTVVTAKLKL